MDNFPRPIQKCGTDEAEMVSVPAGRFTMGDTAGDGDPSEKPTARVIVGGFWLDRFEVTFDQFVRFVQSAGYKPQGNWTQHKTRGGTHPVVNVTWPDAKAYCQFIAFIEQPEVIAKILTHLGLWPALAHSPPLCSIAA